METDTTIETTESLSTHSESGVDDRRLVAADVLLRSLMAYEVANFREWDYEAAVFRYRNHASTNRAVKTIARIFSDNRSDQRCESCERSHQQDSTDRPKDRSSLK